MLGAHLQWKVGRGGGGGGVNERVYNHSGLSKTSYRNSQFPNYNNVQF